MNVKYVTLGIIAAMLVAGIAVGIHFHDGEKDEGPIVVTDSGGTTHTFDAPVERIIVFSKYICEALILMEATDKVVGCYSTGMKDVNYAPYYAHCVDMGTKPVGDTVISEIAKLQPDVVISHGSNDNSVLKTTGVPVLEIGAAKMSNVEGDITILGKILGMEDKAKKILDWFSPMYDSLKKVTGKSSISFGIESHSAKKLSMCGPKSTPGETFGIAGAKNIYDDATAGYIYPEAGNVIPLNPGIYLVVAYKAQWDRTVLEAYDTQVKGRPGWDQIDAVKNNKVYFVSNDIVGGMRSVVGAMYVLSLYNSEYAGFSVQDAIVEYNKIAGTTFDTDLVWHF